MISPKTLIHKSKNSKKINFEVFIFQIFYRTCDKYNLGVITAHEFRSGIDRRLGYPMSDKQWEQLQVDVGRDQDGLVPYTKFLQLFDIM